MRKIRILGGGCHRCNELAENAETAAKDVGIEFEIEKVAGINDIFRSWR